MLVQPNFSNKYKRFCKYSEDLLYNSLKFSILHFPFLTKN